MTCARPQQDSLGAERVRKLTSRGRSAFLILKLRPITKSCTHSFTVISVRRFAVTVCGLANRSYKTLCCSESVQRYLSKSEGEFWRNFVHRSLKFLTFSTESTRQPRIQETRLRPIHFSFFGGSFFNRQASVLVTLRRMPHPISSPADRANMVKGIPIRQNMIHALSKPSVQILKKQYSVK